MSNVTSFPKSDDAPPFSSPQAEGIAASVSKLFGMLSLADQQVLVEQITTRAQLIPASRAKEVLATVVRFLPRQEKWTAEEIRKELAVAGVEAGPNAVFNAIGYLVRKKRVVRLGGGRYQVGGQIIVTSDDLGGQSLGNDCDY